MTRTHNTSCQFKSVLGYVGICPCSHVDFCFHFLHMTNKTNYYLTISLRASRLVVYLFRIHTSYISMSRHLINHSIYFICWWFMLVFCDGLLKQWQSLVPYNYDELKPMESVSCYWRNRLFSFDAEIKHLKVHYN